MPSGKKINWLANPHFAGICEEFLRREKIKKINASQFFVDYVLPRMPESNPSSWNRITQNLRKQLRENSLSSDISLRANTSTISHKIAPLNSAVATQKGIHFALNIGYEALRQIRDDPSVMPLKDRLALLFTAMNAQNNRVNAIAALRKDNREEKRFQKSFTDAAYMDVDDEDMEKSIDLEDTKDGENDKELS